MIMQVSDNSISQKATEVYVKFIKDPFTELCNRIANEVVNQSFRIKNRTKSKIKRRRKRK